jgi:hypothetical protein
MAFPVVARCIGYAIHRKSRTAPSATFGLVYGLSFTGNDG